MKLLLIDGQGGGLGRQLAQSISERFPDIELFAIGTNSAATAAMLRGGAKTAATGENAVKVACRHADVIVGPLGMVIADSMMGEISPEMALSVAQSDAVRILIPSGHCHNLVVGVGEHSLSELIAETLHKIGEIYSAF